MNIIKVSEKNPSQRDVYKSINSKRDREEKLIIIKTDDTCKDLLKHAESVAKKLWDNPADEIWNDV